MSQSLANVALHLVFSTKRRTPWLKSPELRIELYAYMASILRDNVDSPAIRIGGIEDHVHILFQLSRKFAIKDIVQQAKTETSKWLKKQSMCSNHFSWQLGYGIFSVSESNVPSVCKYIDDQIVHHQRMTFQDEFRELCRRHGIEIDEQYVWE